MKIWKFLQVLGLLKKGELYYIGGNDILPAPLKAYEESAALAAMENGDEAAKALLIERNLRLVAHIMKKYYAATSDQEDLISIGTIGLIKGISTFDASKGARLATYAARCVENAILTPTTLRVSTLHPKA